MAVVTLANLRSLVYSRLEGNELMYSNTEVNNALNEAYRVVNLICAWKTVTVSVRQEATIANRAIYDVPESIVIPQKVSFEGKALEKSPVTQTANYFPKFLTDTTYSTGKPVSRWIPIGITKFAIHPADSIGGGLLQVTGITNPDEMVNDSDTVYIPKEGLTTVIDYSAHVVQCKLQGTPFRQSLSLYSNFQQLLKIDKYYAGYKQPSMWISDEKVADGPTEK